MPDCNVSNETKATLSWRDVLNYLSWNPLPLMQFLLSLVLIAGAIMIANPSLLFLTQPEGTALALREGFVATLNSHGIASIMHKYNDLDVVTVDGSRFSIFRGPLIMPDAPAYTSFDYRLRAGKNPRFTSASPVTVVTPDQMTKWLQYDVDAVINVATQRRMYDAKKRAGDAAWKQLRQISLRDSYDISCFFCCPFTVRYAKWRQYL